MDVAAESAAAIGVRHVIRTVKPDEMMDALPLIVWYLDDPVADPALVPLWFIAREARRHVKVVLSGEGADELFGGYTIYREPLSLAPFEKVPGALRGLLGRASTRLPDGMRGKDLLRRGAIPLEQRYYGNARIFRDGELAGVLRQYDPRRSHTDVTAGHYAESAGWDPVARMQHVDLFTWLRGDILVKADKMTMANSLELRVPFLDPEVFAVASGLPRAAKLGENTTKLALRKALGGHRPPARAAAAQAGLPRAHPALAARRDVRLGARHRRATARPITWSTWPPSPACSTPTATARSTTAAASGRCWCSCSGTGSSWSSASPRRSPSPPTRCCSSRPGPARRRPPW